MQNESKKVLDIDRFIDEIKVNVAHSDILKNDQRLFFGKVSICFERGRITHVEKYEVIK
jgi:hypothetical protein